MVHESVSPLGASINEHVLHSILVPAYTDSQTTMGNAPEKRKGDADGVLDTPSYEHLYPRENYPSLQARVEELLKTMP